MCDDKKLVDFKLNGRDIQAPKGSTVMEIAKKEGVYIPHFCWHPRLSVAGVCRLCLVKVVGRKKLEISCNLEILPGMEIETETSEIIEARKWILEFHLINHPLDCPICDQAGECSLQDYYMEIGKYKSQMDNTKVLKPKVLDIGSQLVLDTERCILCARCTRFEDEVTKTSTLGIFHRGDSSVIGTYPGKSVEHIYQGNLVDICPVGAFTSKDFRFKKRAWLLKSKESICPGCSNACAVDLYLDHDDRYYRIKYIEKKDWICDYGRNLYKNLNKENRLTSSYLKNDDGLKSISFDKSTQYLFDNIQRHDSSDIALLISPQYTNQELSSFFDLFVKKLKIRNVYQWRETDEDINHFDSVSLRGDHNSNTKGLQKLLKENGFDDKPIDQIDQLIKLNPKFCIALSPEVIIFNKNISDQLKALSKLQNLSIWTSLEFFKKENIKHMMALKAFSEKTGSFINHNNDICNLINPIKSSYHGIEEIVNHLDKLLYN